MPCPFCGRVCNNLPNLRSHISGCKTQQFLTRTNDLPLPLVTHSKKEKGSNHDPSQERNAQISTPNNEIRGQEKQIVLNPNVSSTKEKSWKFCIIHNTQKERFTNSVIVSYYICFGFKCYHLFFAIRYSRHGIKNFNQ